MAAADLLRDQHPLATLVEACRTDIHELAVQQRERPSLGQGEVQTGGNLAAPAAMLDHPLEHRQAAAHAPRLGSAGDVGHAVHLTGLQAEALDHAAITHQAAASD